MYARENGLIGHSNVPGPEKFKHTDSLREFVNNLEQQPDNWIYRELPIEYSYNRFGHRTKEPEELSSKYILFIGCSHTEGVGLPIDRTYSFLVARKLRTDYYNMAVGGTGPDVVYYNLRRWLETDFPKPALVLIQWPDPVRFLFVDLDKRHKLSRYFDEGLSNQEGLAFAGSWNMSDEEILEREKESLTDFVEIHNMTVELLQQHKIKYLDFHMFQGKFFNTTYGVELTFDQRVMMHDYARDLMHSGIKTNKKFAKMLINKIERDRLL